MKRKLLNGLMMISLAAVSFTLLSGFGLGDALKGVGGNSSKCDDGDNGCKNKEHLKDIAVGVAVGVAAKLIADMIIEAKSEQTSNEGQVISKYKKAHGDLPGEPVVTLYSSIASPGKVINVGNELKLDSDMEVVPAKGGKSTVVQEQITIFDAEDNTQELRSFSKTVNKDTNKAGAFKNQFKFTMPKGLPQGVYPIKTAVVVDNKRLKGVSNDVQLVLNVDERGQMTIVALNESR